MLATVEVTLPRLRPEHDAHIYPPAYVSAGPARAVYEVVDRAYHMEENEEMRLTLRPVLQHDVPWDAVVWELPRPQ